MTENNEKNYAAEELAIIEITEKVISAKSFPELKDKLKSSLIGNLGGGSLFFYVAESENPSDHFFSTGIGSSNSSKIRQECLKELTRLTAIQPANNDNQPATIDSFTIFPLWQNTTCVGLLGLELKAEKPILTIRLWGHFLTVLASVISNITTQQEDKKQLEFLNTYMSISSLLAQEIDLHDMLEATLYCCMDMFSAEAASILLLDEQKEYFTFYQVEGSAKQALMTAKLPAGQGIAGAVLQSGESELINNLAEDPRFHKGMDEKSKFTSRNMMAIPLIAGEEQVGVLEILNKLEGEKFSEEEHLAVKILAEEIAFAIRNAKIFDYVVTSYCKQRQGLNTCKGCKRPLGTWTPCIKYRESSI